MKWVGLTGGIATGKSTVSKILRDLGIPVVDADQLAREVTAKDSTGLKAVVKDFGPGVLLGDGTLDRKALGKIIFSDESKRLMLEGILHPQIQEFRARERRRFEGEGFDLAFYDVPLLFEKNMEGEFDATVLVYCKPAEQKRRLMERDGLSAADADVRLRAQLPIDEKLKRASYTIFNEGSPADLKSAILQVLSELRQ